MNKTISSYHNFYERVLPTGSRVIVSKEDQKDNPPKDDDYIMLVSPSNLVLFETHLRADGWELGGSMPVVHQVHDAFVVDESLKTEHTFTEDGKVDMSRVFHSWKKRQTEERKTLGGATYIHQLPDLNIILTCNKEYFEDFTRATFLAKALNLTNKEDRVILFEALTRDVWPSGEHKEKKGSNLLDKYDSGYIGYEITHTPVNTITTSTFVAPGSLTVVDDVGAIPVTGWNVLQTPSVWEEPVSEVNA